MKRKTRLSLYGSLAVNLLYVGMNAVSARLYHTNWFAILAVYYAIMALMRFLLLITGAADYEKELCRARTCAYILMTVNLTLSGIIMMMVYFERGFQYRGYLIYAIAAYTFYITTTAVIDLVKYRKYHSPVMSMAKVIKLAAALFSMLFLETAMFSQFGQDTAPETKRLMIILTGAGICVIVSWMSLYVIRKTSGEIRKEKKKNAYTE